MNKISLIIYTAIAQFSFTAGEYSCHNIKPLPRCDHRILSESEIACAAYMMQHYGRKISHLDADLLPDSSYIVCLPLSTPYSLDDR